MAVGKYDTHVKPKLLTDDELSILLRDDVKWEFIGDEKAFEENIVEHIDEILEGMRLPQKRTMFRQKQFRFDKSQIVIDILVQHIDNSITIFEVKKKNEKHPQTSPAAQVGAIGQLMLYKTIIGTLYDPNVRLVLIDNKIHYRTFLTIKSNNIPIALMEFQKDFVIMSYIPKEWR